MKTATRIASVLAVVVGMSFVLGSEAQAGCKSGIKRHRHHHHRVRYYKSSYVKRCKHHHYGYCSYYKRYGFCKYYVPAPVGGPAVIGTVPAPAPGIPAVVQPSNAVSAAVVQPIPQVVATSLPGGMVIVRAQSTAQTTAQTAQTGTAVSTATTTATTSPSIDEVQLTAIVAAVQSALEQPKQAEKPKIDPEVLKALEQLIDQKMAEAAKATEAVVTEAAPLPETEQATEQTEGESNDSTLESLSAMIAQLLAQKQAQE